MSMKLEIDSLGRQFIHFRWIHELEHASTHQFVVINIEKFRETSSNLIFLLPIQIVAKSILNQLAFHQKTTV